MLESDVMHLVNFAPLCEAFGDFKLSFMKDVVKQYGSEVNNRLTYFILHTIFNWRILDDGGKRRSTKAALDSQIDP